MTIGSQLRDIYITALEAKSQKSPIILLDDKDIEASPILKQMVSDAAVSNTGEVVNENFTVRVKGNGQPVEFFALHVFARALKGESTKSKQRASTLQEGFEKRYSFWYKLLMEKKFSPNPKLNEGKSPEDFIEEKAPAAAVPEPELVTA
jgi:hypothetical protein